MAQGVQQLHAQWMCEPAQGAGVETADLRALWFLGLVHAYKGSYAKKCLQGFLCNSFDGMRSDGMRNGGTPARVPPFSL
ncbi:hypothetical protein GCM10027162_63400 [Streptomyces incanus]